MGMTKSQGTILARLIAELRPEWEFHGIMTALGKAAGKGNAFDITLAAVYATADPAAKTPAFIAERGPHWDAISAGPREDTAYVQHRRSESIAHRRALEQARHDARNANPEASHRGYLEALKALKGEPA